MNLTIARAALAPALKLSISAADPRSTMPILAHVRLVASKGRLTVTATDLNVSITSTVPAKVKDAGEICLDAKRLSEIVSGLPAGDVTIKVVDGWAEVRAGRVNYRVVGLPAKDFPKVAAHDGAWSAVNATDLAEMIARVEGSVCHDETRFHLTGILWECNGERMRMVTTDGHRLSLVDRQGGPDARPPIIVPIRGAVALKKLLETDALEIAVGGGHLFARSADVTLAVKLIDAVFPPYDQVVPKHKNASTVNRVALLDAVKRAGVFASEVRGVKVTFASESVTLQADDPATGEVREEIEHSWSGADLEQAIVLGLNGKYLADALATMHADEVRIEVGGSLDPIAVRPVGGDATTAIIMPMRV